MFAILCPDYNTPEAIDCLFEVGVSDLGVPVLIVDDGSSEPLKLEWRNAKVVRIEEGIPWGMPIAINMGFRHVKTDSLLRADVDHFIKKESVDGITKIIDELKRNDDKLIARFVRHSVSGKLLKPHPNTCLARVDRLLSVGGDDERFSGNYGHDDSEMLWRLSAVYDWAVRVFPEVVYVNERMGGDDLRTDSSRNLQLSNRIKAGQVPVWAAVDGEVNVCGRIIWTQKNVQKDRGGVCSMHAAGQPGC